MANAAEFLISIEQQVRGDDAVSELAKVEQSVRDGIASFKAHEAAALKTQAQREKVGTAAAGLREKMDAAMKANNPTVFWKAAAAAEKLSARERELKASLEQTNAAMEKQKAAVTGAAHNLSKMRSANEKGGASAALANTKFEELAGAFSQLGGPAGGLLNKVFSLGGAFQKLGANGGGLGLAVAAAALGTAIFAALLVSVVAAGVAVVGYGIKAASAARQQRLLMEATFESKTAAAEMSTTFRQLEKSTGASSDRLFDVSKQLKEAGLEGDAMKTALKAIATQEAAVGQDGTAKLIEGLKSGNTSAEQLAKTIETKYGANVAAKMIGLDQSVERLGGNFGQLFSGLNIDGVLVNFSKFVDMFDETSVSGQVMKGFFETMFQPLVNAVATSIPYAQLFIAKFINQVLQIAVAVKPAVDGLSQMFGITPSDAMAVVMTAAEFAATAFAVSLGTLIAVIAGVGLAATKLGQWFAAGWAMAKAAWTGISSAVTGAVDSIAAIDLASVATGLIDGFINGIKEGAAKVKSAVSDLGNMAKNGLERALDMHSPSKVFHTLGGYTAEGFQLGVEDGSADVERAVSQMVNPEAGTVKGAGRAGGPITVNLTIHGVTDRNMTNEITRHVEKLFNDIALELGATPEAA